VIAQLETDKVWLLPGACRVSALLCFGVPALQTGRVSRAELHISRAMAGTGPSSRFLIN
jgi:hypothetical protein